MDDSGTFTYRKHKIDYQIDQLMNMYARDWRIKYKIRINDGEWLSTYGMIPLRLPDIKKAVKYIIDKENKKDVINQV
jgi:hypothetical protein